MTNDAKNDPESSGLEADLEADLERVAEPVAQAAAILADSDERGAERERLLATGERRHSEGLVDLADLPG